MMPRNVVNVVYEEIGEHWGVVVAIPCENMEDDRDTRGINYAVF